MENTSRRQWEEMTVIEPGTTPGTTPEAGPDSSFYWRKLPFGIILLLLIWPKLFPTYFDEEIEAPRGLDISCFLWCAMLTTDQFGALQVSFERESLKKISYRLFSLATCLCISYYFHERAFDSPVDTRYDVYASCRDVIIPFIMKHAELW